MSAETTREIREGAAFGTQAVRSRRARLARVAGAALLGLVVAAPFAAAQDGGTPKPEGEEEKVEVPDPKREALDKRAEELTETARKLAADYEALLGERVREHAGRDQTLKRLYDAGIFTAEGLTVGINRNDPLGSLKHWRHALKTLDMRADELTREFIGDTRAQNEQVAVSTLRKIARNQETFRNEDRDGDGILNYAKDLAVLARYRLFERDAKNGFKANGYVYEITYGDVARYVAIAVPERPGVTGDRYFYVDNSKVLRVENGKPATASSAPLKD